MSPNALGIMYAHIAEIYHTQDLMWPAKDGFKMFDIIEFKTGTGEVHAHTSFISDRHNTLSSALWGQR